MRIKSTTTIGRLVEEHPEAEEVMAWYGIDLEECRPATTLASLCRARRLDVDDVIADLASSLEEVEDEDEDWDDDEDSDPDADDGLGHEEDDAWVPDEDVPDADLDEDDDSLDEDGDDDEDNDEPIAEDDPFDLN
jgi:hypothetical protein